jgi:hypothetical protein
MDLAKGSTATASLPDKANRREADLTQSTALLSGDIGMTIR